MRIAPIVTWCSGNNMKYTSTSKDKYDHSLQIQLHMRKLSNLHPFGQPSLKNLILRYKNVQNEVGDPHARVQNKSFFNICSVILPQRKILCCFP